MAGATPAARPFSSPVVGNYLGDSSFGYGWRELLLPVAGFRIHMAGSHIHKVENILASTLAAQHTQWEVQGAQKMFVLLPDEFVAHVDAEFLNDELCGLRLRTNLRTSTWFGRRGDSHYEFHADADKCIKALQGTFADTVACELGVVYSPLAWEVETAASVEDEHTEMLVSGIEGEHKDDSLGPYVSLAADIRAVVVVLNPEGSSAVQSIQVVTAAQYEALHATETLMTPCENEHWFVLADAERITGVGVTDGDSCVLGLRFVTNLRTSLWYGKAPSRRSYPKTHLTSLRAAEGQKRVCGFRWSGYGNAILRLGVVFAANVADTNPSKTES
jgi:hypothetical protein